MSKKIVMGYWDCTYCGAKGIKGTTYDCPTCGKQRGDGVRFYMKDGPVEYIPGKTESEGADWYCDYCNSLNKASATVCENCGSARMEAKTDYFTMNHNQNASRKDKRGKVNDFHQQTEKEILDDVQDGDTNRLVNGTEHPELAGNGRYATSNRPESVKTNPGHRIPNWRRFKRPAIILMIILFVLSLILKNQPHQSELVVEEARWTATEDLEQYRTVAEGDWSIPSGGRVTDSYQKISGYTQVLDHYETVQKSRQVEDGGHYEYHTDYVDNGNGTFTEETTSTWVTDYKTEYYTEEEPVYRDVPVYDTWYEYDIDKWVYAETFTETGTDSKPHYTDYDTLDDERITNQHVEYTISGTSRISKISFLDVWTSARPKEVTYKTSEDILDDLNVGDTVRCMIDDGTITAIQDLE